MTRDEALRRVREAIDEDYYPAEPRNAWSPPIQTRVADLVCSVRREALEDARRVIEGSPASIPMLLWCPWCAERHIDEGEFAITPHHTHACQFCGMVWRPAIVCTVGVVFLPGFKNVDPREVV